jgi:hypothetical protein
MERFLLLTAGVSLRMAFRENKTAFSSAALPNLYWRELKIPFDSAALQHVRFTGVERLERGYDMKW